MHAIETERSLGRPSLMVTTRRRLMPHGTSFSFLQAVTQALHSMQRSASQRNFIRAMFAASSGRPDLAEGRLRLLHPGHRIEAVGGERVHALADHIGVVAFGVSAALIDTLEYAGERIGHPGDALADALGDQRLDARFRVVFGAGDPDPAAV